MAIAMITLFVLPLSLFGMATTTSPFVANATTDSVIASSIDGESVNGPSLVLSPGIPIVIDLAEDGAIDLAVADLQQDLEAVFSQASPIYNSTSQLSSGQSAIVVTMNGSNTAAFRDATLDYEEGHQVSTKTVNGVTHIVLQGADIRGAIYAVYTFSNKVLGIPPLWRWMDNWQPETQSSITIAANSGIRVASPQVKHRAWFLNNQDLWGGWTAPAGVDKYDLLFETMLRLKLNTYYIGESVGEYGGGWLEKAEDADSRGLMIASNSLATFRKWDQYWTEVRGYSTVPQLSLANEALFEDYWDYSLQYGVDQGFDMVWVLGFRGEGDGGFWLSMPDAPTTDAARGDEIEQQVQRQINLVRSVTGQTHPTMAFLLWNELSALLDDGNLQLPNDADVMWLFGNDIRDHFPGSGARTYSLPSNQPIGYYFNQQFYSTGAHLAEAEGITKLHQNFDILENRRPGQRIGMGYFNVGNVREFLLTASAGAEMMWNVGNYQPNTGLQHLLAQHFGSSLAPALSNLYQDFLEAYWQQKGNDITGFNRQYLFQDLRIKEAINEQLSQIESQTRNLNPFNNDRMRIDDAYNGTASNVGSVMVGSQAAYQAM